MEILSSYDLQNGKTATASPFSSYTASYYQPIQFLPESDKNDAWIENVFNWHELQSIRQIRRKARRIQNNRKLVKGVINKSDYIIEEDNENLDIAEALIEDDPIPALELKFFPLIPNIINILRTEFSERTSKISFRSKDDTTYNEILEQKKEAVASTLIKNMQLKQMLKLQEMGLEQDSDEYKQEMSEENIKSLPEIEQYFRKSYKSVYEIWAQHQYNADRKRFHFDELEEQAFTDRLTTDASIFHFRMGENDYFPELWMYEQVAYHKSTSVRYLSQANWVSHIDLLTIPDVIDKYGWMMNEQQLKNLETIYPIRSAMYMENRPNDGGYYDSTRTKEWNSEMPSLAMRQFTSKLEAARGTGDIINLILGEHEDLLDFNTSYLLRVMTLYWKTQRRIGLLTSKDEYGNVIKTYVSEDYKIHKEPIYESKFNKEKTKETLVYGEHIDWIWVNEVWGGIKIGPNKSTIYTTKTTSNITPIFLGVQGNKPSKVPYQFKGDDTIWGCKLPVEGCIFSDRTGKSMAPVDLLKPYQIGFNIVNNQISDILVDELGTIILFDQNGLPRNSMGEDWGKNNLAKAYTVMKNFQMLPVDYSIDNVKGGSQFSHFQPMDLSQTARLKSRVELANYFQEQAARIMGLNPERLGTPVQTEQTATGITNAINSSYKQTEMYFIEFCDYLMPRVHQMRTELAQYYHSTNPSLRLQYLTSADERVVFEMDGTNILLRDIDVQCETDVSARNLIKRFKDMMYQNNTTGASIYDLWRGSMPDNVAEMEVALKKIEEKQQQKWKEEQQMKQQEMQQQAEQAEKERQFRAEEAQKNRENDLNIAAIRGGGLGAQQDINANAQSDYLDLLNHVEQRSKNQQQMDLQREKQSNEVLLSNKEMDLKRDELQTKRDIADKNLQIAKENRNKYSPPLKNTPKKK